MTDQEVAAIVGNLAPYRVAHPSDPTNPLSGRAAFAPYDGGDPQPGDMLEFRTPHGTYQFLIGQDGSWQLAGQPTAPAKQVPSGGYSTAQDLGGDPQSPEGRMVDLYAKQLNNPDVDQAVKNSLLTVYNEAAKAMVATLSKPSKTAPVGNMDPKDPRVQALAQAAVAKGPKATQQEMEAYFTVHGNGGGGEPVEQAIDGATQDARVRVAMRLGALLEGGNLTGNWNAGDGGVSYGPFQINTGAHPEVTRAQAEDPSQAVAFMLPEYVRAVQQVPASLWSTDPQAAAARAAYLAERPAVMYPDDRVAAAYRQVQTSQGSGGIGQPAFTQAPRSSVVKDVTDPATGMVKHYQYNPATGKYEPSDIPDGLASTSLLKPTESALVALSQHARTIDYIKQQLAGGSMTLEEANQYQQANDSQLNAALQGTTPFDLLKQKEALANQQALVGKDLINQQLQTGATMVDSLISNARQIAGMGGKQDWTGFNPFQMTDAFMGEHGGGSDMADVAKGLVNGFANVQQPQAGAAPGGGGPGDDLFARLMATAHIGSQQTGGSGAAPPAGSPQPPGAGSGPMGTFTGSPTVGLGQQPPAVAA